MKRLIRLTVIKLFRLAKGWERDERYDEFKKKYNIHTSFRFNGESILLYGKGRILLGENSYIGSYSTIQSAERYSVVIGRNCRISHNVRIYTASAAPDQDFSNYDNLNKKSGDVVIQDNVWIGANVFINPGITIGENSIVGANSVVIKDVPAHSIYGGVPAKLIRYKSMDAT